MKSACCLALGAALTSSVVAIGLHDEPSLIEKRGLFKSLVTEDTLMAKIKLKDLMNGAQKLQDISDKYDAKNRVFGEDAHKDTVDWIYNEVKKIGYYKVYKEEQKQLWTRSKQKLTIDSKELTAFAMTYSPSGKAKAEFKLVSNLGCKAEDYKDVEGKITLGIRGECSFAEKAALAYKAKAKAAVLYNNGPGELRGTLGGASKEYVPIVGISQDDGKKLVEKVKAGKVTGDLMVETKMENRTTWNVIAETRQGDHNNVVMLGSHSDSVDAGPGINDNGSGSIGLLTIAKALAHFRVKNAVRFGWWTAEEFGLLGSEYYTSHLKQKELDKIRLYLNFDMIASPNYANLIYDGDGSSFNVTGPAGSAELEKMFQTYFEELGLPHEPTAFDGRSDYDGFIQRGIPAGGIFTGAEVVKSKEQAALYGGEAGKSFDPNYHAKGDTIKNLHKGAFLTNARGAAYATAKYAQSLKSLPPKEKPKTGKRDGSKRYTYEGVPSSKGGCSHQTVAQ